jgi:hypothetical protein
LPKEIAEYSFLKTVHERLSLKAHHMIRTISGQQRQLH